MEEKKKPEPWKPIFPEDVARMQRERPPLPYKTWRPKRRKKPKPDTPPKS